MHYLLCLRHSGCWGPKFWVWARHLTMQTRERRFFWGGAERDVTVLEHKARCWCWKRTRKTWNIENMAFSKGYWNFGRYKWSHLWNILLFHFPLTIFFERDDWLRLVLKVNSAGKGSYILSQYWPCKRPQKSTRVWLDTIWVCTKMCPGLGLSQCPSLSIEPLDLDLNEHWQKYCETLQYSLISVSFVLKIYLGSPKNTSSNKVIEKAEY